MITIRKFPSEVSDYIELPDIAELLMSPFFFDTDIDEAYKYGTEFQRKLLEMTPLRGDKATMSILSEVKLLAPDYRACTIPIIDPDYEWHIDCEEKEDTKHIYNQERDYVHLLTNKVSSMCEFNKNTIHLADQDFDLPYNDFIKLLHADLKGNNDLGVIPQKMPHNQIVTFSNHMHRATNSNGYELKYMYRVVETNRKRKPGKYNPNVNTSRITDLKNQQIVSVMRLDNQIKIFIPNNPLTPTENQSIKMDPMENTSVSNKTAITTLDITDIGWESNLLGGPTSTNTFMKDFTPKNSIMLLGKGDYSDTESNEALCDFFKNIDSSVQLISDDGDIINSIMRKDYYNHDDLIGKIYGIHILLNSQDVTTMKSDVGYKVVPRNQSRYKLNIVDHLRIFKIDKKLD
jgi:hypothetical protein